MNGWIRIPPPPSVAQQPPSGPGPPNCRGFTITLTYTAIDRIPLDECSARRRDLYLTTHNSDKDRYSCSRQDSKPQSLEASGRRPTPYTAQPLGSAIRIAYWGNLFYVRACFRRATKSRMSWIVRAGITWRYATSRKHKSICLHCGERKLYLNDVCEIGIAFSSSVARMLIVTSRPTRTNSAPARGARTLIYVRYQAVGYVIFTIHT